MKIAIAGGTGFIGTALTNHLVQQGHHIYILTRKLKHSSHEAITYVEWLNPHNHPERYLEGINAFINLAGESINSGRWNKERKDRLVNSRMTTTQEVIRIIQALNKKPDVLVNASAIGIYGTSLDKTFNENDPAEGRDYLANTTQRWEQKAKKAIDLGVRTVFSRFGIVLDQSDGALPKMTKPYQMFAGGTVGTGEQWLSWIHIKDAVRLIEFALEKNTITGPLNITSPQPVKMKPFGKTIGKVLHRPHWIPAPAFALKLLLGEMSMLVLEGQKVLPEKAIDQNFNFLYPHLENALQDILLD